MSQYEQSHLDGSKSLLKTLITWLFVLAYLGSFIMQPFWGFKASFLGLGICVIGFLLVIYEHLNIGKKRNLAPREQRRRKNNLILLILLLILIQGILAITFVKFNDVLDKYAVPAITSN